MKKLSIYLFIFVAWAIGSFLFIGESAEAAGETYTWRDPQTITVTGGDLVGSVDFPIFSVTPGTEQAGGSVDHESGCDFQLFLTLTSDTAATIQGGESPPIITDPNNPGPPWNGCDASIYSTYTGAITIVGPRDGGVIGPPPETQAQRAVVIRANFIGTLAESPTSISFAITSAGVPVETVTLARGPGSGNSLGVWFEAITHLDPGVYQGCDNFGIGCVDFTKVEYVTLRFSYGETAPQATVTAHITLRLISLPIEQAVYVPAMNFTLTSIDSSGNGTFTARTREQSIEPTEAERNAAGSGARKDIDILLHGYFTSIPPGRYQLCFQTNTNCQDITKVQGVPLDITLDPVSGDAARALLLDEYIDIPRCENVISNGFGWLICPGLRMIDGFLSFAENVVQSKLQVNETFFEDTGELGSLQSSWQQMARVASGLLVMIGLVMIISTAMGFDLFSTYTVKKVLPRLAIGAIGIWLSWALLTTYISLMNDLGNGIASFMFSPFRDGLPPLTPGGSPPTFGQVDLEYIMTEAAFETDSGTDIAAGLLFTSVVAFGIAGASVLGVIAAAIPVAGAMLIGLFLLSLREVLIIFLLVISPLAFAAWILPNTNKIWKLWENTFNKLLLLFPLFMAIFAAGKIFALISAQASSGGNTGFIEVMIPLLAYVSPFFFIPALFKFAGGVFGNLTGMVNNRSKGAFDKLSGVVKSKDDQQRKIRADNRMMMARQRGTQTDVGALRRARDRWALGAFGGARRETRDAMDLERQRQRIQAEKERAELARMQPNAGTPNGQSVAEYEAQERANAEIHSMDAQVIRLEGDSNIRMNNPNLEVEKAVVEAGKAQSEADTYRADIEASKVGAEHVQREAQNQAFDDYEARTLGRDLHADRGEVAAEAIAMGGRMYDRTAALSELQLKEMSEAAKRSYEAANIETVREAGDRQELYGLLAGLADGTTTTIRVNGVDHEFTGSEAVRQTALSQMLKGGMFDDATTSTGGTVRGLSDGRGSGILDSMTTAGSGFEATAQRFRSDNFGDLKDKAPDLVMPAPDLSTVSSETIPKMHKTRQALWREQFTSSISSGSADQVARTLAQINDLANPNIQRTLKPEFFTQLYAELTASGMPSAQLDEVKDVLNSGGRRYFDETGAVATR